MDEPNLVADRFGQILGVVHRALSHFENVLNLVAGLLIAGLMFFGVVQIVTRTAFNAPIFGYIDIVELSMVGFAVLAISYVQREGGHVRMELLVSKLKGRWLWFVELLSSLVSIFIVAVLIPYSYQHFQRAFNIGDSTIDIELATWPAKLVVPFALTVLLVRLVVQVAGYFRLLLSPNLNPVAIPLLKDVDTQAQEEIALSSSPDVKS